MDKVKYRNGSKVMGRSFSFGLHYCNQSSLHPVEIPVLCYYKNAQMFWFRIFGYGLHIADRVKNPPLFSERNGFVKTLKIGKWSIKILKP